MHHGPTAQSWYPKKSKGISVHSVFRARDRDVMLWKKCPPQRKKIRTSPTPQLELVLQLLGEKLRHQQIQAAKVALIVTGVQTLVYQCIRYYSWFIIIIQT